MTETKYLKEAAEFTQKLINIEFDKFNGSPLEGSELDQCGLKDGVEIVVNYINHGENGLALEHLIYMIEETNVEIPEKIRKNIRTVAKNMDMNIEI